MFSPSFESLSKGMGSIKRSPRRLARLSHTNVNPAVASDLPRSITALSMVYPWLFCMLMDQHRARKSWRESWLLSSPVVLHDASNGGTGIHP